jgi:hypothetical protein
MRVVRGAELKFTQMTKRNSGADHALDALQITGVHQSRLAQVAFALGALCCKKVTGVGLGTLDFSVLGQFEALLCASIRFCFNFSASHRHFSLDAASLRTGAQKRFILLFDESFFSGQAPLPPGR